MSLTEDHIVKKKLNSKSKAGKKNPQCLVRINYIQTMMDSRRWLDVGLCLGILVVTNRVVNKVCYIKISNLVDQRRPRRSRDIRVKYMCYSTRVRNHLLETLFYTI